MHLARFLLGSARLKTKGKPLEDIEDYWANGRSWENVEEDEGGAAAQGSRA